MEADQEHAFVQAFIHPDRQERYLQLLGNPKRRDKILGLLYHALDVIHAEVIANRDHTPELVERRLRRALETLISQDGTAIVCCLPGRLAYYKAEIEAYILERK